ncbi:GlsB/YeaQ/YmgE family stress response membrane protein [Chitinibacter fontanus]|uniref:GlsB/YeaQ/YmgE family stress response membrane protein n=2 Tax=Chitinibacter fontanus TaxID=1737446 RepID=A0A7D5ZC89_9NEIS|nr:GlsB/YeaQ/YmgE family stress response membrane protein [Chitinibacter fontanus]
MFGGLFGVLSAIVIGLLIGVIAKILLPGRDTAGWCMTCLIGIAGSWLGHLIFNVFGAQSTKSGIIGAVFGAMLLHLIYRVIKKNA